MKAYLEWRCRTNWHNKYRKYINEWVSNVTPTQLEYFKIEKQHLTDKGVYYGT
mgnify:CR=1 FL=1